MTLLIKNNILDYIYKNYECIENEMNSFSKKVKKKTLKKTSKKTLKKKSTKVPKPKKSKKEIEETQNNLTLSATKKVNKHNITITVKFN